MGSIILTDSDKFGVVYVNWIESVAIIELFEVAGNHQGIYEIFSL